VSPFDAMPFVAQLLVDVLAMSGGNAIVAMHALLFLLSSLKNLDLTLPRCLREEQSRDSGIDVRRS
jgi:hypothetical protein